MCGKVFTVLKNLESQFKNFRPEYKTMDKINLNIPQVFVSLTIMNLESQN